jgi:hypothetical protein
LSRKWRVSIKTLSMDAAAAVNAVAVALQRVFLDTHASAA